MRLSENKPKPFITCEVIAAQACLLYPAPSLSPGQIAGIMQTIEKRVPLGGYGEPEEVAKAVLFLASDNSSLWMCDRQERRYALGETMKPIDTALAQAARNVVEHCLGIQAGEVVSIVTDSADPDRIEIARAFWEEARAKGAEVILAEMLPRKNSGDVSGLYTPALPHPDERELVPTAYWPSISKN